MYWFLNGVVETFIRGQDLTQEQMWKIGMRLMPMYKTWCKLLIFEASVSLDKVAYKTQKDEWKVHPIFKAISDHHDKIERAERRMGIERKDGSADPPKLDFVPPTQVRRKK
jgi:hypothetical protein